MCIYPIIGKQVNAALALPQPCRHSPIFISTCLTSGYLQQTFSFRGCCRGATEARKYLLTQTSLTHGGHPPDGKKSLCSSGGSVHLGCDTTALPGSSFPYYLLSPNCVWNLATTRGGLAVVLGLALIIVVRYFRSPWRRVPPGPRGLPLIGNALELRDKLWLFHRDCKQKYEDMIYLNALGQPILVLNSLKAVAELFDRRGNIYSSRPRLIMAQEICAGNLLFPLPQPCR
ncbi:hypothetical protein EDB85DRAFT_142322 [Lactarius pseudohatsudake]|nr:hypothetical protein EDB85DRAFT_142322 [Lactarius pseudohatsudake]